MIRRGISTVTEPMFEEFTHHVKFRPRFNIAPSQSVPIVRVNGDKAELSIVRWGLIPYWSKDKPKLAPINARAETVATSAMFRHAFERRRCLVPADGFYEWQGAKPPRQPFFIHKPDDSVFTFAGLWERWRAAEDDQPLDTFTIITTTPNKLMAEIHNRMPVVLNPGDYGTWLDTTSPADKLRSLLAPYPDGELEAYPVSPHVNSPKNDDPECAEPI